MCTSMQHLLQGYLGASTAAGSERAHKAVSGEKIAAACHSTGGTGMLLLLKEDHACLHSMHV